jgi:sigma-E factor negative regulatory protein RseA
MKTDTHFEAKADSELVSALADGQLQGDAFLQALELLEQSEQARTQWDAYHLTADVMHSGAAFSCATPSTDFLLRLRKRMASQTREPSDADPIQAVTRASVPAANDPSRHWRWMAVCASVVASLSLGWNLSGNGGGSLAAGPLAQWTPALAPSSPGLTTALTPAGVMIRDSRIDQLLAEHQQFGGTSALQMPTGFLRNATFEKTVR